jgi:hypothetical protein
LNWRNCSEYICFRGVFKGEKVLCPGKRNRPTLAIGNLTGPGAVRILANQRAASGNAAGLGSGRAPQQAFQDEYSCQ